MTSLIAELKRRNIFRVATVYAVGSWVVLQLADILLPATGLPEGTIGYVVAVLLVGFPLVIAFSWLFEITPDGLMLTKSVSRETSISDETGRKIDFTIIGLLSVALAFFMFEYFDRPADAPPIAGARPGLPTLEATSTAPKTQLDLRPSVAVLPFVNMSSDEENEYFADGLSEELLNVLAQIQGLRVAGRTSSFFYKGKNINLTEIGAALKVDNILEGSVRKSGSKVRITAQLVSAKDGFHLWSQTFDREIKDIFAIQDEISKEVSKAMQLALLESTGGIQVTASTTNTEAHEAYLRGKQALYQRTVEQSRRALDLFRLASKLDAEYAPPLLGIADTAMVSWNNHNIISFDEMQSIAKEALDKAAALDYQPSEYWATKGLYHSNLALFDQSNLALAEEAFQKAINLNPNNASAMMWYASTLGAIPGDHRQQALELYQRALQIDPLNRVINGNMQIAIDALGRKDEAKANLTRLRELDPGYLNYSMLTGFITFRDGDVVGTLGYFKDVPIDDARFIGFSGYIIDSMNDHSLLNDFLDHVPLDNPAYDYAEELSFARDKTRAEVIARANVMLLQPDRENLGGPLYDRLIELGEFGLVRQLLENTYPDLAAPEPALLMDRFAACLDYMVAIYELGEKDRARHYARAYLDQTKTLARNGITGKGAFDVIPYLVLGDVDRAVAEIAAAYTDGWRTYYADRMQQHPWLRKLEQKPRVVAVRKKVDKYIAEVREPVIAFYVSRGLLSPPAQSAD